MEELVKWLEQGSLIVVGLAAIVLALNHIANGGGRFGNWLKGKMTDDVRDDVERFMTEHAGCKPKTERELAELKGRVDECEKLLGRDWTSIRLLMRMTDAHGEHIIHGNHMEQVKRLKDEQHEHLLNN